MTTMFCGTGDEFFVETSIKRQPAPIRYLTFEERRDQLITKIIQCISCDGTGLLGKPNQAGEAYSCPDCGGAGSRTITFRDFSGRRKVDGVVTVFSTYVDEQRVVQGKRTPYSDFLKGR